MLPVPNPAIPDPQITQRYVMKLTMDQADDLIRELSLTVPPGQISHFVLLEPENTAPVWNFILAHLNGGPAPSGGNWPTYAEIYNAEYGTPTVVPGVVVTPVVTTPPATAATPAPTPTPVVMATPVAATPPPAAAATTPPAATAGTGAPPRRRGCCSCPIIGVIVFLLLLTVCVGVALYFQMAALNPSGQPALATLANWLNPEAATVTPRPPTQVPSQTPTPTPTLTSREQMHTSTPIWCSPTPSPSFP